MNFEFDFHNNLAALYKIDYNSCGLFSAPSITTMNRSSERRRRELLQGGWCLGAMLLQKILKSRDSENLCSVHACKIIQGVYPDWRQVCRVKSRNQKQPGFYLEGGRERTVGTRLLCTDGRMDGRR